MAAAKGGAANQARLRRKSKTSKKAEEDEPEVDHLGGSGPVFQSIELATADQRPDYMPYERVAFPRVTREAQTNPVAEMDAMWMVGFLDHEEKHGPSGPSAQTMKDYEKVFGGRQSKTAGEKALADKERDRLKRENADKFLSKEELARLKKLERELKRGPRKKPRTLAEKTRAKLSKSAYSSENRKIRRVLALRSKAGKKHLKAMGPGAGAGSSGLKKTVLSTGLENLAYLERLEHRAAAVVQRAFRRFMRMIFWRKYLVATKAATTIQRAARGYIIRRLVRQWVARRESLVTKAQAVIRGKLARDAAQRARKFDEAAASDIQRVFRGHITRKHWREGRRERAIVKIQAAWRGAVGRSRADLEYLHQQAVTMQAAVRGYIQRQRYRRDMEDFASAACRIQALFRGYMSRMLRNELLWQRETGSRQQWMAMLRAEENWIDREIQRRVKARAKENLETQIARRQHEWAKACDEVMLFEYDLLSLHNERIKLSPRAIQQGWATQLKDDVDQHRKWVTKAKARALFLTARSLRSLKQRKQAADRVLQDMLEHKQLHAQWWVDERVLLWRRENERNWAERKVALAKRAADEKRKWQVKFYTETGKPDLRKPPGHTWDPSLFPHAQQRTLTIAHGDLLALTRPPEQLDGPRSRAEAEARLRDSRLQLEHYYQTVNPGGALPEAPPRAALEQLSGMGVQATGVGAGAGQLPALPAPGGAGGAGALAGSMAIVPHARGQAGRAGAPSHGGRRGGSGHSIAPTVDAAGNVISGSGAGGGMFAGSAGGAGAGSEAGSGLGGAFAAGRGISQQQQSRQGQGQGRGREQQYDGGDGFVGSARGSEGEGGGSRGGMDGYSEGGSTAGWEEGYEEVPRSLFEEQVRRAQQGLEPMPAFMQSGLATGKLGNIAEVDGALRRKAQALEKEAQDRERIMRMPPGLLAARRAEAASTIARARATGMVGHTSVAGRREERRREIEAEMDDFRRMGSRVQMLTEKLGAVSGAAETMQYGALLKPMFDNMQKLLRRLRTDPSTAAEELAMPGAKEKNERERVERERRDAAESRRRTEADMRRKQAKLAEGRAGAGVRDRMAMARRRAAGAGAGHDGAAGGRPRSGRRPQLAPLEQKEKERRALLQAREEARALAAARGTGGREAALALERGMRPGAGAAGGRSHGRGGSKKPKRKKKYTSTIPWSLLDELEAEKDRLQAEKAKRLPFERAYDRGRVRKEDALAAIADEA